MLGSGPYLITKTSMSDPLILYATETGNAQDVADYIARQCRRLDLTCRLQNMETYPPVRSYLPSKH